MHVQIQRSIYYRLACVACTLLLMGGLWPGVAPALAQGDDETVEGDVLFLFDTTTGMADFLVAAHEAAAEVLDALADKCNPGFAVAQYRDWPPQDNLPWHLVQSVTLDREAAAKAVNLLFPDGGGDRPDSVGWALHSALGINWHADAVKVIVLVGGAPPQDPDPGADGAYGTADDLLFADVVSELVAADVQVIGLYTDDSPDTGRSVSAFPASCPPCCGTRSARPSSKPRSNRRHWGLTAACAGQSLTMPTATAGGTRTRPPYQASR